MSRPSHPGSDSQSASFLLLIEDICTRFEDAWKAGEQPRIEDYLGSFLEPARSALLRELAAVEREYRARGDTPVFLNAKVDKSPVRLRRYRVTGRLGTGSFGVVFKGHDEGLRRDVAIKVPHPARLPARECGNVFG